MRITGKTKSNSTGNRLEPALKKGKRDSSTGTSSSTIDLTLSLSEPTEDNAEDTDEDILCLESKSTRRKRTSNNNAQQKQHADKNNSGRKSFRTESNENDSSRVTDPQQSNTPEAITRVSPSKSREDSNLASTNYSCNVRYTPDEITCVSPSKSQEYINLAFTKSNCDVWRKPDVIDYCKRNNVMYILRGISGSGKSRTAWRIKHLYQTDNAYLCSADDLLVNYLGQNDLPTTSIPEQAHNACQERARAECLSGRNVVIIDNTNIKAESFRYYLQLAHYNDYIVVVIAMTETDIDKCFRRNKHNVPRDKIALMKSVYEEVIPFYYGWFMSISDTFELRSTTCEAIRSHSTEIPDFKDFMFRKGIDNIEQLFLVYNMKKSSSCTNMLHVTSCYTNCGKRPGSENYAKSKSVIQAVGDVCKLQVIGLCITPRSLFARVLLSENQKLLWGNDDAYNGVVNELCKECNFEGENSNSLPPNVFSERANKMSRFRQTMPDGYLLPDYGVGCTAHLTLGVVEGCSPVQSGKDLKAIICAEMDCAPRLEYRFPRETMRLYEGNLWVVYFKESLFVPSMFCGAYFAERLT